MHLGWQRRFVPPHRSCENHWSGLFPTFFEFSIHFPSGIHTISSFHSWWMFHLWDTQGFFFRMFWTRYRSPSLIFFFIDRITCISTNLRIWYILMTSHCYEIVDSGSQRRTCCRRKLSPVHFRYWKCFVSNFFEVFSWGGVGWGEDFYDRSVSVQILTWHRWGAKPLSERMVVHC